MRVRRNYKRLTRNAIIIAVALGTFFVLLIGGVLYINRDRNPIPENLRASLTFSPLVVPLESNGILSDSYRVTAAENGEEILSYTLIYGEDKIMVSQYTQPIEFTEIPEYRDRFLSNVIQQTEIIQTANGAIYLGSLSQQENKQVGVMLENGLLVFLAPEETLNPADWRRIGESLEVQRLEAS